jgi:hypothetical protein
MEPNMNATTNTVLFQGIEYNAEHGSPFDRGSADSYYSRPQSPHKYPNGTYNEPKIEAQDMSLAEMREYYKGYEYNEQFGDKKSWD